ncbi:MAG: hypothetical protein LBE56_01110, partial [Tannerella sp.]|nr:hypothetical protein [Tannerella sp.]
SDLAPVETFGELFDMALNQLFGENGKSRFLEMLEPGYTYMFELAGPYNRIVVPYRTTELYFIGVRNMLSGLEINPWDYPLAQYIKVPERYSLRDIDSCLAAVETMGYDQEGFVVVDKYFNRVKIKSPQYVAAHYLKNNNVQTVGRLLKIILAGEEDEFCSYFPEFRPDFERIEAAYNQLIITLNLSKDAIATRHFETRKDLAIHVIANCKIPEFHFWSYENHWESAENWFRQLPEYKQERLIKNFLGLTL